MTATPAMSLPQAPAVRPNPAPTASPVCDPPYRQHPGLNSHTHTTDRRTERQPSPHDTSRDLPHPPHPHELTHPLSARLLANNSPAGTPNHSHPPHSESRHLRATAHWWAHGPTLTDTHTCAKLSTHNHAPTAPMHRAHTRIPRDCRHEPPKPRPPSPPACLPTTAAEAGNWYQPKATLVASSQFPAPPPPTRRYLAGRRAGGLRRA